MSQPDPVLRDAIKRYLTDLPADDRSALMEEVREADGESSSYPATWGYATDQGGTH
ncbi:hypothetical protein [Mycolicibacterium porcinum]|uniref:hypothetical protein n=1 Tax=Mycolicibacterium porcinum TaxID=39693 RepID=UPI0016475FC3|nr:hypothetical protein [Mycolicibacterium porcinum]